MSMPRTFYTTARVLLKVLTRNCANHHRRARARGAHRGVRHRVV